MAQSQNRLNKKFDVLWINNRNFSKFIKMTNSAYPGLEIGVSSSLAYLCHMEKVLGVFLRLVEKWSKSRIWQLACGCSYNCYITENRSFRPPNRAFCSYANTWPRSCASSMIVVVLLTTHRAAFVGERSRSRSAFVVRCRGGRGKHLINLGAAALIERARFERSPRSITSFYFSYFGAWPQPAYLISTYKCTCPGFVPLTIYNFPAACSGLQQRMCVQINCFRLFYIIGCGGRLRLVRASRSHKWVSVVSFASIKRRTRMRAAINMPPTTLLIPSACVVSALGKLDRA